MTAGFLQQGPDPLADLASARGQPVAVGRRPLAGALLTSLYTFRMVFLAFFGPPGLQVRHRKPGWRMKLPLVVLAVLSARRLGSWSCRNAWGDIRCLSDFLAAALPAAMMAAPAEGHERSFASSIAAASSLGGILSPTCCSCAGAAVDRKAGRTPAGRGPAPLWFAGWGFDWLYDSLVLSTLRLAGPDRTAMMSSICSTRIAWLNQVAAIGLEPHPDRPGPLLRRGHWPSVR